MTLTSCEYEFHSGKRIAPCELKKPKLPMKGYIQISKQATPDTSLKITEKLRWCFLFNQVHVLLGRRKKKP